MRLLALLLWLTGAVAVTARDSTYAERLPELNRVLADYRTNDPTESRIRQAAACYVLSDTVELFMGSRYYRGEWRGLEQSRRQAYANCVGERMVSAGRALGAQGRFVNAIYSLRKDPAFVAALIARYVAPVDRSLYVELKSKKDAAEARRAIEAQAAYKLGEVSRMRDEEARNDILLVMAIPLIAGLIGVLGLIAALRPMVFDTKKLPMQLSVGRQRFNLSPRGGVVAGHAHKVESHHVRGSETRDGNTGALISSTPGYSYDVTTDTLFIVDKDGRETAERLVNWGIAARPGHRVGIVRGGSSRKQRDVHLVVWNFDLDESLFNSNIIRGMLRVPLRYSLLLIVGVVGTVYCLSLIRHGELGFMSILIAFLACLLLWTIPSAVARLRRRYFRQRILPVLEREARRAADLAMLRANGLETATAQVR